MRLAVPGHLYAALHDGRFGGTLNAAVLIVDVEGSTRFAAALEPHGRDGASSLANALDAVFEPVVRNVRAYGGFIAEFAGDGALAIFPGDPEQAASAAVGAGVRILEEISTSEPVSTPLGPSSLRVRAVVSQGAVTWRAWSSQRVDVTQNATFSYVGPAVREAQRGEAFASGGVLAAGPSVESVLRGEVGLTPVTDGFWSVDHAARPPIEGLSAIESSPGIGGAYRFFPPQLTELDSRGEYRDVVAVFLDLDVIPEVDDQIMVQVLERLHEHRGFLSNVASSESGVRLFALWGAPTSYEHDIGYAIRFVDSVRRTAPSVRTRAGVSRSTAYAGLAGTADHASYTAIGSGINLAARFCDAAAWGEIRVGRPIAVRLIDRWGVEDLGELSYRGFDDPVPSFMATNVPPARQANPLGGQFVGRSAELDELEDAVAPLWRGASPGVVMVAGPGGVGKSRIVEEMRTRFSSRQPEPVWLRAQADEIRAQPLATLADALSTAFGPPGDDATRDRLGNYIARLSADVPILADDLARGRQTLGDILALPEDRDLAAHLEPRTRFENAVAAISTLLRAEAARAPVVLHIADGHWLDTASAAVIERIREDLEEERVAVVLEARSSDVSVTIDEVIDIGPLNPDDIEQIAALELGSHPSAALVEWLAVRSDGNALFLRQLLDYVDRSAMIRDTAEGLVLTDSDVEVPADIGRLLVARLDELDPATRRIVQLGSVLGRDIDIDVLTSMASAPDLVGERVRAAASAGVWSVDDDGSVSFTSAMTQGAAYSMLLPDDVRTSHLAAAAAVETLHGGADGAAGLIAHHLDRAGEPAAAAEKYVVAGAEAQSRFDNELALDLFSRAADLGEDQGSMLEALQRSFEVHDVLGNREAQGEVLTAMAEAARTEEDLAELAAHRVRHQIVLGEYGAAETLARSSFEATPRELAFHRGVLRFLEGQTARYLGRSTHAAALAREARTAFEGVPDPLRMAMVDDFLGGLAWDQGDYEEAATLHRSSAESFASLGEATSEIRSLNNLGSALISIGNYAEARRIHEAGAQRSRTIGFRMGEGDHVDNVGGTAWAVGDFDLAIDRYSAALAIRKSMDDSWGVAISTGNLGGAYLAQGNPERALEMYRSALEVDTRIDRPRGQAFDLHGIGLCQIALGRFNLAEDSLAQAAHTRHELGETHLAHESEVARAMALQRRGDGAEADAIVLRVLEAEGDPPFEGAVETTATLLRCAEVLLELHPEEAARVRDVAARRVRARSERIDDAAQRASYLATAVHDQALDPNRKSEPT